MSQYRALVVARDGRTDWRVVESDSERSVATRLAAEGLTALEIRSGTRGLLERLNQPIRWGGLGIASQSLLMTQLAVLIRAGLPVDRSLDLLREQAPSARQRDRLSEVLTRVRAGESLAQALEAIAAFPPYVVGVIRAAERSGRLGQALSSLAQRMTAAATMRQHLITSLTYPAAVLGATGLALVLVLTIVVPQFRPIFAGQEAHLPTLTRVVVALSDAVVTHGLLVVAAFAIAIALVVALARSAAGAAFVQRFRGRIPGMGLRDQYLAGQLLGLFGMLLTNGMTVIGALPYARGAVSSLRWRAHLSEVEQRVREGLSLSRALAEAPLMPVTAIRLIEVGERSGSLADTCLHASDILSEAARARLDRIVTLVNPIAIVALGALVATLVAGVMLGIFSLGDFVG